MASLFSNTPVSNRWRFAQGYYDSAPALYKFGQRFYDPALGRWTQQDPVLHLGDPMQVNRYSYVGDSPCNFVDPTGTSAASACAIAAEQGAIVGAFATALAGIPVTIGAVLIGAALGCAGALLSGAR